jgi:hypothetical protein
VIVEARSLYTPADRGDDGPIPGPASDSPFGTFLTRFEIDCQATFSFSFAVSYSLRWGATTRICNSRSEICSESITMPPAGRGPISTIREEEGVYNQLDFQDTSRLSD